MHSPNTTLRRLLPFHMSRLRSCLSPTLLAVAALLAACSSEATSQADGKAAAGEPPEKAIPKALAERVPQLPPVDEVRPAPMAGLYEVRFGGTEIIYTDAKGDFVLQGALIDTRTMSNLTDARIEQLTAVAWDQLPLKDAMVFKQGDGSRKLAVFADPNCGYCKRFERDLVGLKDVTIYAFLMPILGPDSQAKSRDIWCSADAPKAWRAWMIDGAVPPRVTSSACDAAALERNIEFGRKHRITGTPALVFQDGSRKAGALPMQRVEELLAAAAKKS